MSGFANYSGGLLIWGIKANKNKDGVDAAQSLKPIKELLKFENHLKGNEGSLVVPTIGGIKYKRIESSKDQGFLLVYIPSSERAPYMALFDKHYYKRNGDSFYICEHFDIMDILQRKTTTKLQIDLKNEQLQKIGFQNENSYRYESLFCIENIGQVSAKYIVVFIKIHSPFHIADYGIDGNRNRGMKTVPTKDSYGKYEGGIELVIHLGTYQEIDKIALNEIRTNCAIGDLKIEYEVIAEGMQLLTGEFFKTKEELIKLMGV